MNLTRVARTTLAGVVAAVAWTIADLDGGTGRAARTREAIQLRMTSRPVYVGLRTRAAAVGTTLNAPPSGTVRA
jgi:hypothetical protein